MPYEDAVAGTAYTRAVMSERRIVLSEDDFQTPPAQGRAPSDGTALIEGAGRSWFAGMALPLLVGTVITAMLGVSITVVVVSTADTRPDFCEVLDKHRREIRANVPDTSGEPDLEQFVAALGNVGRFQTMLDDLARAAPPEIKSDMETSRDTFKAQIDSAPGAADGFLATVVGNIYRNLIHSSSFENVDAYAQEHCGATVFGPPKRGS